MQSTSASDGSYSLTVTFAIGTDLNFAQVLVQNRVSSALASLPQAVQAQGVIVQKKSTAILEIVTLTSPDRSRDSLYLSNYATISLKDELSRLPGVGNVSVFGAGQYAMRVWLDPDKMQARGLTTQDVSNALSQQSQDVAAGQIGAPPTPAGQAFQYTLNVSGRLDQVEQFENVIVKVGANGADDAAARRRPDRAGRADLRPGLHARREAGRRHGDLPDPRRERARRRRPRSTRAWRSWRAASRRASPFQSRSTPRPSCAPRSTRCTGRCSRPAVLVLVVILVFLQDWRAMLVPATTVPVTIIGAFAAMAALGFSVNLLDAVRASCWRSASWSTTRSSSWRTRRTTSNRA